MSAKEMSKQLIEFGKVNGVQFYGVRDEKFKTDTLNIFFLDNLSKENVAKNALLPAVLKRGTEKFNTMQEISIHLDGLYGAITDIGVHKKGEIQVIQFYLEGVSDKYSGDREAFGNSVRFLMDMIQKPLLRDGNFLAEYVEQEKQNIKNIIEGRINDKASYAYDRCIEEMCANEKFAIFEYGDIADYENLNETELTTYYRERFLKLPKIAFLSGNFDDEKVNFIKEMLGQLAESEIEVKYQYTDIQVGEKREFIENMDVTQGKLCLGYRTFISPSDENYYAALVFNSILGGGMHSKLFQNVREKEGLAYYAFSRMDKYKGILTIASGIEIENKEKVLNIILNQINDIKNGNISDYELEASQKTIETAIKALKDSQLQTVDYLFGQLISGTYDSLDQIIEKVRKITKADCIHVANNVKLDTVYFLTK